MTPKGVFSACAAEVALTTRGRAVPILLKGVMRAGRDTRGYSVHTPASNQIVPLLISIHLGMFRGEGGLQILSFTDSATVPWTFILCRGQGRP